MSADAPPHRAHDSHGDAGQHQHHGADDHAHGSRKTYLIGFGLSVLLTAVPFWLVMAGVFTDTRITAGLCMAFALVQIVVHMIYFLHMNSKSEGGWTLMALIFTVIIVVIVLAGSLWVMYHMNQNMMPGMQGMEAMDAM